VSANRAPAASEFRLAVTGMTCPTCERSLERAIGTVPGVLSVAADHRTGEVRLRVDPPPADAAIREAVEDLGYDLVGGPDGVGPH
jgi:copper chaperone CopZ